MNKKLLTALLVLAMLFSFGTAAFAATFSDIADLSKDTQASIAKLNALNIINGYPDGTFKPANNITRAEFAKIACIAGGMGTSAEMLQGTASRFSDVAASQWYTGYINLANSQNWVKGYPDGTFRPNNQISYAEVITVLVRILGYNDNLPGPWPVDYIAKAGALDITKNVSFNANAPATRADVAVMADETLDATIVKWDNDTQDFEKKEDRKGNEITLLDDAFDTAVNEDYWVTDSEYDNGVWSIKVKATDEDEDALDGKWLDLNANWMASDASLANGLGDKIVDILYDSDEEEVLYTEVLSTRVTVDGEDWEYDKNKEEFKIDGTKYDKADYFTGNEYGETGATAYDDDGYYRAYVNEDKEVYKVSRRNEKTPAIVEEFDGELTLKDPGDFGDNDQAEKIDFKDDTVLVEKGGAFVEPKALAENDVIYVTEDLYGYDYYIEVAGSVNKTGKLDSYKTNNGNVTSVRIDGTSYDVAEYDLLSDNEGKDFNKAITEKNIEDFDGKTITYFLNKANQVCIIITGEAGEGSNRIYGVITDLGYRYGNPAKINEIKVLKADGKETTYDVDTDEVEIYEDELNIDEFIKFAVNADNDIDSLTVLAQLNDDEVIVPTTAGKDPDFDDYIDTDNDEYVGDLTDGNSDNNRIRFEGKWLTLDDKTVVFNAGRFIDDDAEVIDNDDLVDWAEDLTGAVTVYVEYSNSKVEYVYLNDDVTSATAVDYALVLDNYKKSGKDWVEIDVKGTAQNYEVKNNIPVEYAIYDYSISSNKFSVKNTDMVFDPEDVTAGSYYEVEDVDRSGNAIKMDGEWFYGDADTIIYDYTDYYDDGDDPLYASSVRAISKGDLVFAIMDDKDPDVVNLFVIVTGVDAE
ncbi:S-layer homology domain-containing protein [Dehalobacterium formicoaceticum]|uniref:S-layer homology domain-containing protein n=1 Tax=Dehalobacterium formicoaceticum TaxID=51515 RepID=A0ABT1Y3H0_9FIRM|nr:S-layer homology domain-containing protein [Dehalobacterium formicoaceticum]MCR6545412.1 S-layer homology domain-containing protein [Dehalobacterium formicoaceticum]